MISEGPPTKNTSKWIDIDTMCRESPWLKLQAHTSMLIINQNVFQSLDIEGRSNLTTREQYSLSASALHYEISG
jgi:hypothetical protein